MEKHLEPRAWAYRVEQRVEPQVYACSTGQLLDPQVWASNCYSVPLGGIGALPRRFTIQQSLVGSTS